jgi:GDP-D-mannose dehydratase
MKASHSKKKTALVFGISGDKGQFVARGLLDSQSYDTVYGVTHAVTAHALDVMARRFDVTVVRGRDGDDNDDDDGRQLVLLQAQLSDSPSVRNVD